MAANTCTVQDCHGLTRESKFPTPRDVWYAHCEFASPVTSAYTGKSETPKTWTIGTVKPT